MNKKRVCIFFMGHIADRTNHADDFRQTFILTAQILNGRGIHIESNHIRHDITSASAFYRFHDVLQGTVHCLTDFQKYICGDIRTFA